MESMIDSAINATKKFNKTEDESKLILRKIVYGGWKELEELAGEEGK